MNQVSWRELTGALGAEAHAGDGVEAVDVKALDGALLKQALLRHQLLVLRDQVLTPEEFVAIAARLGELERYPFAEPLAGTDYVVPVVKEAAETHNFGGAWHTDTSYLEHPPAVTLLYAVEVPERGGDTLFADMYRALETLSDGFRRCLGGLRGCNTAALVHDANGAYASVAGDRSAAAAEESSAVHPVVRVHPDTGRAALYVSLIHTERFFGMTREESLPLLQQLQAHAVAAENCSRLRWRPGTLAIWDNRCVQHYPLNDYPGQRREMYRIIVRGEAPVGSPAPG